ncbi:MAG TPA: hypothetical protein EYP68_08610 [Candidatus Korarchaeota archaeon]|nr:hypothetical protein [Candidatus Korarchaeota archaeon]
MRSTLIIGLGGTGVLTCKLTKKLFSEEFGGQENIPINVKFLSIDTKTPPEREESAYPRLPQDADIGKIVADVPKEDFRIIQSDRYLADNPEVKEWLARPLPIEDASGGAWEIRQAGRLAFWRHRRGSRGIQQPISSVIDYLTGAEIRGGLPDYINFEPGLDVFIINSLAGGTGSGMFFDVAGIIKQRFPETEITLISLLPEPFVSRIDSNRSISQLYANTYATLKEIDYYMRDRAANTDHRWKVTYSKRRGDSVEIGSKCPFRPTNLFDSVFLIDKVNRDGESLIDRLRILPLVANYLYHSIMESGASLRDSRKTRARELKAEEWCSSFGCSILSFPLEEIKNVCIPRLLKEVIEEVERGEEYTNRELQGEIEDDTIGLVKNKNLFDHQRWMSGLLLRTTYSPQRARSVLADGRRKVYANLKANVLNSLGKEFKSDSENLEKIFPSLLERLGQALKKRVADAIRRKGLSYASELLKKLKDALVSQKVIKSQIDRLKKEIETVDKDIEFKLESIKRISKKRIDFSRWMRYAEDNLNLLIDEIAANFENKLEMEKLSYVSRIIEELSREKTGMIDEEIGSINSRLTELKRLKDVFSGQENESLRELRFSAAKEEKIGQAPNELEEFYKKHFIPTKAEMKQWVEERLIKWEEAPGIQEDEAKLRLEKLLKERRLDALTLRYALPTDEEMNRAIEKGLSDAKAFWRHTFDNVAHESFIISGFSADDLRNCPAATGAGIAMICTIKQVDSDETVAKKQRKMVFVTVEYGVPIRSVRGLEMYAQEYKEHEPQRNRSIHLTPQALDFEELLPGFTITLEEEDLLETCRDLGIVFQRANSFQYTKTVKEKGRVKRISKEIARGYDNTVKTLQQDPSLCKFLIEEVKKRLNAEPREKVEEYLTNHELVTYQFDEKKSSIRHGSLYKDAESGKPIPFHRIPSYIKEEIEKRLRM